MERTKRRLQEISGSLFMSLPKSWLKNYKLRKGDEINISVEGDGSLRIAPVLTEKARPGKKTIKLDRFIVRNISSAYLGGHEVIEIVSDSPITSEYRKIIQRFLQKLMNVEIIEETANRIVLENFGYKVMPVDQALKRMYFITHDMLKDMLAGNQTPANVEERDESVNKFYFMIVMHLRTFMSKGYYAFPEAEFSLLKALDYRLVAQKIERIGDLIKEIVELSKKTKNADYVLSKVNELAEIYELAFFAFIEEDLKKACAVWDKIKDLRAKTGNIKKTVTAKKDVYAVELFNALRQIVEYSKDIADLVKG